MPLGNLEKLIEEQADKFKKNTGFFTKRKIVLFILIIFLACLSGGIYLFRNYIGPVNNIIANNVVIHKNLKLVPQYIQKADFTNASLTLQNTEKKLEKALTQIETLKHTGYDYIDKPAEIFQNNIQTSKELVSNLNKYVRLLDQVSIRIKLYDNYVLINAPRGTRVDIGSDNINQIKSKLKDNLAGLDESCSQKNRYSNKLHLCPSLYNINQSLAQLVDNSKLNRDIKLSMN